MGGGGPAARAGASRGRLAEGQEIGAPWHPYFSMSADTHSHTAGGVPSGAEVPDYRGRGGDFLRNLEGPHHFVSESLQIHYLHGHRLTQGYALGAPYLQALFTLAAEFWSHLEPLRLRGPAPRFWWTGGIPIVTKVITGLCTNL